MSEDSKNIEKSGLDNFNQNAKSFDDVLSDIELKKTAVEIAEQQVLDKALASENPFTVAKAVQYYQKKTGTVGADRKSYFIDPNDFYDNGRGYKDPASSMSYATLVRMSRVPLVQAIIKTRANQVATFARPQEDRFTQGFVIKKKGFTGYLHEMNKKDRATADRITQIILDCGVEQSWSRDDFETFIRKITADSLVFDQLNFEAVRTRGGKFYENVAIDATTVRIADSYHDREYEEKIKSSAAKNLRKINGYYPSYVQIHEQEPVAEFYPWELSFGIRNPSTRIFQYNYGRSELEDLHTIITGILNADKYNSNFFRVGSAPKGMIRVKGGTNNARISEFRRMWKAMMSGVENSWKTPIMDAESMEWIDLQKNNRDMEFSNYQEHLIRILCALYNIDPSEIGFKSMDSIGGGGGLFESGAEQKLKYSKDKGLKPLLRFIQTQINRMIVSQIDPEFYFEFVGLEDESRKEVQERLQQESQTYKTINEIRAEMGFPKLKEGGDIILNPSFTSNLQQQAMMNQAEQYQDGGYNEAASGEEESGDDNWMDKYFSKNEGGDNDEGSVQKAVDELNNTLSS